MKLNAVGVASSNLTKTVEFYKLLGFDFPSLKGDDQYVESNDKKGSIKLMIDSFEMVKSILGYLPKPSNHSNFAILYDNPTEIDEIITKLSQKDFTIIKKRWNAFWGQRYAIVQDPDGYKVDLYAYL